MITVEELAEIVGRKVKLKKIGQNRWSGFCPFHDDRKSPSFQVWKGRRGEGRFHCHGCSGDGDGVDWFRLVEGMTYRAAGGRRPDPAVEAAREERRRRKRAIAAFLDRNPDSVIPDWAIEV
jgi:hypothetical protein